MADQTGVTGALTDGTGVSGFTVPKVAKDLLVDFVKTLAAVLIANGITNVQQGLDNVHVVAIAVVGALLSTAYRFILSLGSSTP